MPTDRAVNMWRERRGLDAVPPLVASVCLLLSCAPASVPAPPTPLASARAAVYLNHLYLVVDSATYADVRASSFLREELAGVVESTLHAGDGESWTGTYIFGAQTYIELFPPGVMGPERRSGLAYGVEETGALRGVEARLTAIREGSVATDFRTRIRDGDTIPWFHSVWVEYGETAPTLTTWAMEYHAEYLRRLYPDIRPEDDGITRRQYLARSFDPDRLLDEVVGATVALEPKEAERFTRELTALGFAVRGDGAERIATGPDVQLRIVPASAGAGGIVELRLRLLRRTEASEHRFGPRSVLRIQPDATATWTF